MKLHLPSPLRSALLACLAVVGSMSVTIGTGALATGVVAYAVVGSQAEGAALVNKTFELDGVTYSGAELVTLDVANAANVTAGGASHTISGVANMTVTLDIDGTPTDKKFNEGVHVLNSSGKGDTNKDYAIWQDFCSAKAYYGQTLKLQGASAAWTLTLDFMPMSYGGLITESASDAGSYRIGRTDGALNITANTAAGANMLINAATTLVSNGATVNTAGSWVLNKALTFASATTIAADQEVSLSGAGALNIDGALTMNAGSRITGAQNTLAINGSLALDVAGLSAGAEALISTAGEVRASGLTLNNASSLAAGEYQLIRTTNAAADAMSAQFSGDDRYSVINKDGVVTLMVRDRLVYSDGSGYSGGAVNNLSDAAVSRLEELIFERNDAAHGGAVYNDASYSIVENGRVTFADNSGSTAGAICNFADFRLNDNGVVYFGNNSALNSGGAIDNYVGFELNGNDSVTFSGNIANAVYSYGGAIFNYDMFGDNSETFSVEHNREVTFSGNAASYGGAVYNQGNFRVLNNENVLFRGNSAATGAAVYNDEDSVFSLSGNTNVIFEKNAEFDGDSYRLRSIYSLGTLNLSATGSILFKDSVYASGTVNLNQDGTGDIIFTGASTEADLRSVKVGESGTAQEIADSRSSVLDAVVTLGGGTLQVRDAASLTVRNLTAAAGSELVLHNATFTTTGNTTLSAVTTSGNSTLSAEPGGIITLTQAITNNGMLTLSGTFNADALAEAEEGTASMAPCYINTSGENSESGFYSDSGRLTRYSLTSGTGVLNAADAKVLNGGYEMSVDSNGVATDLVRIINYDKYYINGDSASLSAILAKSPSATVQMAGGTLTVDADCNAEIVHDDTASLVFSARQTGSRDFSQFASLIFEGISSGYNGGAIDNASSFSLSRNGAVTFSGNTASSYGGAIANSGTFTLSGNGAVTFSNNGSSNSDGAIYNRSTFTLSGNGDVTFSGNTSTGMGGAIGNWDTFTLSDNENVTFSGNHLTSSDWSYGGAIDNHGSFTLFGNGSVTFAGNYITSSGSSRSCYGGAIGNEYTFTLSGNGDVTFSGNTASSSSGNVYGGAIYNQAIFTLSGNGDVTFSGNTASSSSGKAYGGAIYNECFISSDYGIDIFTLSGNGNVLFEKNAEVSNGTYRLRSIYSSKVTLNLSASEGKSILFKDSVYASGTVNLNQEGTGDIIFTGASTIADLREVKGGIAGTVQEIANSRSSVLDATVTLGGGTLQVRDAASLTVRNLTAAAGSELVLHDASFSTTGDSTLAAVSVSGNSSLTAQDGATLTLQQSLTNSGTLTIGGTLDVSALTLTSTAATHIDANSNIGDNGFAKAAGCFVQLVDGGSTINNNATVKHGELTLTLNSDGTATGGGVVDYSTYYINGGSAYLSDILAKAPAANIQMTGGILFVTEDAAVRGISVAEEAVIAVDRRATLDLSAINLSQNLLTSVAASAAGEGTVTFQGRTGTNLLQSLVFNTNVSVEGDWWLNGRFYNPVLTITEDHTFLMTGELNFGNTVHVSVDGGTLEVQGGLAIGHSEGNYPATLSMSSGEIITSAFKPLRNDNTNTIDITGGKLTITGERAFIATGESTSVSISNATLTNGETDMAFNHASTLTNATIAAKAGTTITVGCEGKTTAVDTGLATEGKVDFIGTTLLLGDAALTVKGETHIAELSAGGSNLTLDGNGSLALTGDVSLNSLTVQESTLKLDHASLSVASDSTLGGITTTGNTTLAAQNGATMTLQQAITNNGELTLSGTIIADALTATQVAPVVSGYLNTAGEVGTSGFYADSYSLSELALTSGTGMLHAEQAEVMYQGNRLTVGSNGIAQFENGSIDYSTYYINGDTASLSAILAKSPSATVQMAGGTLMVDRGLNTEIVHDNTASLVVTACQTYNGKILGYESVSFKDISNFSILCGGAINGTHTFTMSDNEKVIFSGNTAVEGGGAIYNHGYLTLMGNGSVTFIGNTAANSSYGVCGGAIFNQDYYGGTFTLSNNGDVTFSGNSASYGGAIYNDGTFTLSGNGNVLFEKNAEIENDTYRLRSIYSTGTLNLSASEGKSILFKDSVYARGTVNLNQEGTGDIIFTGISTEADLREVKGGIAGTAQEILNSRTSEIATNAKLYGGRLVVEDGAILKGQGITFAEGADATIRLNGGTLDETGYTISVSSGSGLEFEGENTLAASSVSLADNSFLNFILDEAQTAVNWNANLDIQGSLSLNLTHEDKPVHDTYALLAMQSGNTVTGWDASALTISGTTAEYLVWEGNTLYYRPMLVQENGDTTLDKDVDTDAEGGTIGGKDDVNIDGNGHTLNVKNEVQLVQMALKNGTVKLEGENNGIVSVTLTEGGELVLTAGAGLKTGDIISMVASGKGELHISGNITLDNKGMKGKDGERATLSHADAQVHGDATISNVRMEDTTMDLAKGSTVTFSHVELAAGTRITDDPATLVLDNVTAELELGVNVAVVTTDDVLQAGSTLVQNGNEQVSFTLAQDAVVVQLEATTFDSVTLTGDSLVLQLSGVETEFFNGADYVAVSFTSGTGLATFGTDLEVLLTLDAEHVVHGYYVQGGDHTAMLFATNDKAEVTPEPATATLSLLALAALAARRKRR